MFGEDWYCFAICNNGYRLAVLGKGLRDVREV